jgi:hypothetical protein
MTKLLRYLGQGVFYLLIAILIGYFGNGPAYTRVPSEEALIKFSFSHAAHRKVACRRLSAKELAKLAPNMRKPTMCERGRLPVVVELYLDDKRIYAASLPPSGFSGDGPAQVYARFEVPAGRHRLVAKLRDTARQQGFDYAKEAEVDLKPGQSLAIDFDAVTGGFSLE